uniref:EF-hand domain-containing protein n=1 Tax=Meloidogyne hapla TaxID=6305 RepID=A0A1I8B1K4_MELHA
MADKDKNGYLDELEFEEGIIKQKDPSAIFKIYFEIIDEDGNEKIDYEEMVDIFAAKQDLSYQERNNLVNDKKMRELFDKKDKNKDGQIDVEEYIFEDNFNEINLTTERPKTTQKIQKINKLKKEKNYPNIEDFEVKTDEIKYFEEKMRILSESTTDINNNNEEDKLPIFFELFTKKPEIIKKSEEIKIIKDQNIKKQQNLKNSTTETIIDDHILNWIYGNNGETKTTSSPQTTTTTLSTISANKNIDINSLIQLELTFLWEDGNFDEKLNFDEFVGFMANLLNLNGEIKKELFDSYALKMFFNIMDVDNDNQLSLIEFMYGLFEEHQTTKTSILKEVFNVLDLNKDGKWEYSEFIDLLIIFFEAEKIEGLREYALEDKEFKEYFLKGDKNGDGYFTFNELVKKN